jgi:hypothetical protein
MVDGDGGHGCMASYNVQSTVAIKKMDALAPGAQRDSKAHTGCPGKTREHGIHSEDGDNGVALGRQRRSAVPSPSL